MLSQREDTEEQNVQKGNTIADRITSMTYYTGVVCRDSLDGITVVRVALHITIVSAFNDIKVCTHKNYDSVDASGR
jgi:hypothetical protein